MSIQRWLVCATTVLVGAVATAQENSDCLMCHEDPELAGVRAGAEVSVYIDPQAWARSVHKDFACVNCHDDLRGAELPHQEDLKTPECSTCHDDVAKVFVQGPHGRWSTTTQADACATCHGVHDIPPATGAESPTGPKRVDELCGRCHQQQRRDVGRSPHGRVTDDGPQAPCTACHEGHAVQAPSQAVRQEAICGRCHPRQAREHSRSLHGRAAARGDLLAPACVTCHDHHAILSHLQPESPTATMNVPFLCGRCHHEGTEVTLTHDIPQDRILENYSESIHGEGLFKKGLTVTAVCTSCHTSHNILEHTDPGSSINRNNVARTCMACHARIEEVHVKFIEGRLWEEEPHKIPSCVECHQPHKIRKTPVNIRGAASRDCMRCHSKPDLTMVRNGARVSLHVDEEAFGLGAHNRVACAQCHTEVTPGHPERACATIRSPVDCSVCHAEAVTHYSSSTHGQLARQGNDDAPVCLTCHEKHATGDHRIPTSRTFPRNVPDLCGSCHAKGGVAALAADKEGPDVVERYRDSVHGRGLLASGLVVSASCTGCHRSHQILPADNPASSINRVNLADTCGACHKGIEETFKTSVHWPTDREAASKLPTCEDCHSSHSITRIDSKGFRFRMMDQCGRCHSTEAATFFETFHGKKSRLGSEGAAKCYDCHGTHDILPVADPDSTLSRRNVVATCAKCHPGAHRRFAGYLTHATHHDPKKYPYLFYSFWFMTSLLVGTLTFAILHTLAWLWRLWRTRAQWLPLKNGGREELYKRFDRRTRIMHLLLILSFFTLALTGMALKFSYMTWAQVLSRVLGGFGTTGVLHRLGAVVLISLFVFHLRQVWVAKRRANTTWSAFIFGSSSLMFNHEDLRQVWQSIRWFFGRGPRPHYGRFTYWEKFDYFAVFWGVFVIGSTGLVLWFPELFTRLLPGWSVNVATIIHSDEALLAVAFIFTIHFFNTHFRPDKFPMDPVIFTGRVSVDELRHDKPAEYEEYVENADPNDREARIVGPADPRFERVVRVFGFAALTIGLTLIGLILYTMVFGYR